MLTPEQQEKFIAECRSWIGTKWMHAVGVKGYRVDCIHFIVAIAKFMGWLNKNYVIEPYPRDWALHRAESKLMEEISKFCNPVPRSDIQVGDILLYKYKKTTSHAAYYLGNQIAIHSYIKNRTGVQEFNVFNPELRKHFTQVWRFKGLSL